MTPETLDTTTDLTVTNENTERELLENELDLFGYPKYLKLPVGVKGRIFTAELLNVLSSLQMAEDSSEASRLTAITKLWELDKGVNSFEEYFLPALFQVNEKEAYILANELPFGIVLNNAMRAIQYISKNALSTKESQYAVKK